MLMQNFGLTNKEHYGMLWYFWSGQLTKIDRVHLDGIMGSLTGQEKNGPNDVRLQNLQRFRREYGFHK